ncbi:MAG TPA: glutamate--tRNA ligase, partial [Microbacteriaceae bacterium]|nr:glutamate--tRNA ligase [Microbacteriaceae bacterium]
DVFSVQELIEAFDVKDVNPNPARFDQKKADSINADHIRLLEPAEFESRIKPYLVADGVLPPEASDRQLQILHAAVPLVQSRITVLSEVTGMLGFLFTASDGYEYQSDALSSLNETAPETLNASIAALENISEENWKTDSIQETLQGALIEGLGLKPRFAFGPLRVAVSGRRVSPPLFESLEILGKEESLKRLSRLQDLLQE